MKMPIKYRHTNPYIQKYAKEIPPECKPSFLAQTIFAFPNGYKASVISSIASIGFEVAIMVDGAMIHHHLLGNDIVLGYLTQEETDELVTKIRDIVVEEDNRPF